MKYIKHESGKMNIYFSFAVNVFHFLIPYSLFLIPYS